VINETINFNVAGLYDSVRYTEDARSDNANEAGLAAASKKIQHIYKESGLYFGNIDTSPFVSVIPKTRYKRKVTAQGSEQLAVGKILSKSATSDMGFQDSAVLGRISW